MMEQWRDYERRSNNRFCGNSPGYCPVAGSSVFFPDNLDGCADRRHHRCKSRGDTGGGKMTLTNEATREMRTAISGENGGYSLPLLAPGSYRLEAALTGFKTALRSGIRISVTETTRLDVQLEVGGVSEIVNVEAAPVMLQQESSALGRVTTESVISNLPLVTRKLHPDSRPLAGDYDGRGECIRAWARQRRDGHVAYQRQWQ